MNAEQQSAPGDGFNYHNEIAELEAGWDGMGTEDQARKLQKIFKVVHAEGITEGEFAEQMAVALKMRVSVTTILATLQTKVPPKKKAVPLPALDPIKLKEEKPPKAEKQKPAKQANPSMPTPILTDAEVNLAFKELRENGADMSPWELACAIKRVYKYVQPKLKRRTLALEKMVEKTGLSQELIEANLMVFEFREEGFRDLVRKGMLSAAVLEKIHSRCAKLGAKACQSFGKQLVVHIKNGRRYEDRQITDEVLDEIISRIPVAHSKEIIRLDPDYAYSIDVKHAKASDFQGLWGEIFEPLDPADSAYADRKDDLKPGEILVRVKSMRGRVATVRADILKKGKKI